jgi:hypothetical protein
LSARHARPFIKVNCGALPDGLVESELFGHEKGAFTGAVARRRGRFELADKGTLLLDEVGEMPLDVQVKLLRVIQEGKFERVGGVQTLSVDVRILAATNRDLAELVSQGKFREDLYYRLNVVVLRAPPLRERREDIPLLAEHILSRRPPAQRVELTEDAISAIAALHFPGNVRQLENVIDRLCIFNPGQLVTSEHVEQVMFDTLPQAPEVAEMGLPGGIFQRGVSYRDRLLELERMRFTDEELKHQELFRRVEAMIAADMPAGYAFMPRPDDVARAVLSKSTWAVLALTCHIELFTQAHYRQSIEPDAALSELWKDVFLFHWKEESQHAILDELEWVRENARLTPEQRDGAVTDLIELVGAVDGILQLQSASDAD